MDQSKSRFTTVDEYAKSLEKGIRDVFQLLRETIKEELPEATEVISYQIPAVKLNGKFVIYFAAWKKHTSLYPFSSEMEKSIEESSKYKTSGKGTIQFPLNEPLPIPLIRKIIKFRVKENIKAKKK